MFSPFSLDMSTEENMILTRAARRKGKFKTQSRLCMCDYPFPSSLGKERGRGAKASISKWGTQHKLFLSP